MATYVCPKGHTSQAGDYCDECGAAMAGTTRAPSGTSSAPEAAPAAPGAPCPECETPQSGRFCEVCGYDFIMAKLGGTGSSTIPAVAESAPAAVHPTATTAEPASAEPPAATRSRAVAESAAAAGSLGAGERAGWRLMVRSDASYHARMDAQREPDTESIPFPAFCPERRFALTGTQALIGRRSRSRGIEPEIDLTGPPADPAVSHAHALLITQPDGTWAVVDLESANGTYVNDAAEPIESNVPVPVADGDRVHVGSWTTITVQRGA